MKKRTENYEENLEKYSYIKKNEAYSVSNHTAEWVKIYTSVQNLWNDIEEILAYENQDGDQFTKLLSPLCDEVLNSIQDSIFESLGDRNNNSML